MYLSRRDSLQQRYCGEVDMRSSLKPAIFLASLGRLSKLDFNGISIMVFCHWVRDFHVHLFRKRQRGVQELRLQRLSHRSGGIVDRPWYCIMLQIDQSIHKQGLSDG